jgi:hypothetical protein
MPWYRMHGLMVHMRGTKLPPACCARTAPKNPIVPSQRCLAPSAFLCDWPLEAGGTCDAPLCGAHAVVTGKNRHLCPAHAKIERERAPGLF